MSENYYPRHTPEHLEVIREQPFPSHDIPRLTREVEGLQERVRLVERAWMVEVSRAAHLRAVLRLCVEALSVSDPEYHSRAIEQAQQAIRSTEEP